MKYLLLTLVILTAALIGYDAGYLMPHITNNPVAGMQETSCTDIVQEQDKSIVCEVDMTNEKQLIKVYKGV